MRGVYLIATIQPDTDAVSRVLRLQFNDGNGWRSLFESQYSTGSPARIRGLPGGPLIYFGDPSCGLELYDGQGMPTCSAAVSPVAAAFGVGPQLGYALVGDRVLQYTGGNWTQSGSALDASGAVVGKALWADDQLLVVTAAPDATSAFDRVYRRSVGQTSFEPLSGVPEGNYVAAWAFGNNDIWVGGDEGTLVHFDGNGWTAVATDLGQSCTARMGLWGQDGTLYFETGRKFGRWDGSKVEVLTNWTCDNGLVEFVDIWGNSTGEVFLAATDGSQQATQCGPSFALRWDGTQLHRF